MGITVGVFFRGVPVGVSLDLRLSEGLVTAGSLRLVSFWIFFSFAGGVCLSGVSPSKLVPFWIFFSHGGGYRMPVLDLYLSFLDPSSRAEEGVGVSI